jgi:biopolymer transport protein ExbD
MAIGKVPSADDGESTDGVFAEINITPLTDIFLVLLIIFMVTSSVIVNPHAAGARAGLKVNLPKGGASDIAPSATDLSVAILADGSLALAGKSVNETELKKALEDAHRKNPDTLVIIQADEGVSHGKVVQIMELAKSTGLSQLAIGVRQN